MSDPTDNLRDAVALRKLLKEFRQMTSIRRVAWSGDPQVKREDAVYQAGEKEIAAFLADLAKIKAERDEAVASDAESAAMYRSARDRADALAAEVEGMRAALADLIDVFAVNGTRVSVREGRVLQTALVHARFALAQETSHVE